MNLKLMKLDMFILLALKVAPSAGFVVRGLKPSIGNRCVNCGPLHGKAFAKKSKGKRRRPSDGGGSDDRGGGDGAKARSAPSSRSGSPPQPRGAAAAWIQEPSPAERAAFEASTPVELDCGHYAKCAGCSHDRGLANTPLMATAKALLGLDVTLGSVHGWRSHAKLAPGPLTPYGGVKLGLFESRSHRVVPIPDCAVHHPQINAAVAAVEAATVKASITAYDERGGEGMLRYVQLSVERSTGKVQATFVWNADSFRSASPHAQRLVKALRQRKGGDADADDALFHSIWFHWRTGDGNAIFGRGAKRWHRAFGPEFLLERLFTSADEYNCLTSANSSPGSAITTDSDGRGSSELDVGDALLPTFYFSPMVFRQANLEGFASIVVRIAQDPTVVPAGSTVCELYGGIGLIGLSLMVPRGDGTGVGAGELRCSDENPANERAFELARRSLPPDVGDRCFYVTASAEDALEDGEAEGADVLIVDPPRKGLDQGVLEALCDPWDRRCATVGTLVYVSCGFDALQVQLPFLVQAGWQVTYSEGFALFPGSNHIETLVILKREGKSLDEI